VENFDVTCVVHELRRGKSERKSKGCIKETDATNVDVASGHGRLCNLYLIAELFTPLETSPVLVVLFDKLVAGITNKQLGLSQNGAWKVSEDDDGNFTERASYSVIGVSLLTGAAIGYLLIRLFTLPDIVLIY
jgi:hypothetical protein